MGAVLVAAPVSRGAPSGRGRGRLAVVVDREAELDPGEAELDPDEPEPA